MELLWIPLRQTTATLTWVKHINSSHASRKSELWACLHFQSIRHLWKKCVVHKEKDAASLKALRHWHHFSPGQHSGSELNSGVWVWVLVPGCKVGWKKGASRCGTSGRDGHTGTAKHTILRVWFGLSVYFLNLQGLYQEKYYWWESREVN